ncbi:MAG: UvrB/UvrC motif-containing protein, partial [Elusimicrobia bacterium]|nr:UvrB/UvrC motif-containing protein [Elusimicrobiota bacterium]
MTTSDQLTHIPHVPGVYLMRDAASRILYIGKARDLAKRVASYFHHSIRGLSPFLMSHKISALLPAVQQIDYLPTHSEREALLLERKLIRRYQPRFNTMWRDDKSYPYIKLTLQEDFPRLLFTRRVKRDGARYFGPYPNVSQVKHLLRYLWKQKLFPLRPCKFEFSEGHLPDPRKVQSCLYLHTGACPAPCVAKISQPAYYQIAKQAELFLSGKRQRLAHTWEQQMRQAARRLDFETAAQLRDHVETLQRMNERVSIRAIQEHDLEQRISRSRALSALQDALELPKPPLVIEAFDISTIHGVESVGSLVVFEQGYPEKEAYRHFRIKTVTGLDDFAMMAEVVCRRYRRCL